MSDSRTEQETAEDPRGSISPVRRAVPGKLHRPRRALVAAAELVLAALAVWGAFQLWSKGISTFSMYTTDGRELTSTHYRGNWISGAIALGVLAALLLLDAAREVMLALATRRSRARREDRPPWTGFDEDPPA